MVIPSVAAIVGSQLEEEVIPSVAAVVGSQLEENSIHRCKGREGRK